MPPTSSANSPSKSWLTYVLSPQVLLGGVLMWVATTGWDYYKENRSETGKALTEVRAAMGSFIIPPPRTIASAATSITALERISDVHKNPEAKDLVNRQIAHLHWITAKLTQAALKEKDAADKQRIADEQTRKTEEARKALADAEAKQQAQRAEELKQQEARALAAKQAADEANRQLALERSRAILAQQAFDRAPK